MTRVEVDVLDTFSVHALLIICYKIYHAIESNRSEYQGEKVPSRIDSRRA